MFRKWWIGVLAALMVLTLAACNAKSGNGPKETAADSGGSGGGQSSAQNESGSKEDGSSFDWKRYSGTTIQVLFSSHPWATVVEEHVGEFEQLTGIKVQLEVLPEQQARQKLAVQMAAGGQDVDAYMTALQNEKAIYYISGWYEPLNAYLDDPALTSPEFDFGDFSKAAVEMGTQSDGTIVSIPIDLNPYVLFYRKDLFEAAGLDKPKTLQEVREFASILHDPPNVYGYVNRGLRNANVTNFDVILKAMGGDFVGPDGLTPTLNTPEAVRAVEWYSGMLKDFGPPGVVNFNWNESISLFQQGKVAMTYDGANFASQFEDPEKSTVAGKVGYMLIPPDEETGIVNADSGAYGLAISKGSEKKEATWLFVQWATGADVMLKAQIAGVGTTRQSAWESKEFLDQSTMPPEWIETFKSALAITGLNLPTLPVSMTEYRDIVGVSIQSVIEGADPQRAMDEAQKGIELLMKGATTQ
jgi:multiple sugar transport system substrate-binding protein